MNNIELYKGWSIYSVNKYWNANKETHVLHTYNTIELIKEHIDFLER